MEGYLAAKVMTEGLRRGPPRPTRDTLIAALETLRDETFGGFNVSFSNANHVASKFVELSMLTADGRVRI
jgi:hypothetical protein